MKLQPKPTIGQVVTVDGTAYRVWDIPSYGVLILQTMDGKSYIRLQGQAWATVSYSREEGDEEK